MDQYNSKLNVKYNGMCDTDKFDFFFRHSTPKFFRPKRKKAPRHFAILKTTSLLRQDFMAQESL